ncbi:MAG: hypothetical protein AAGJ97_03080 [Planctomycetota bacterium]
MDHYFDADISTRRELRTSVDQTFLSHFPPGTYRGLAECQKALRLWHDAFKEHFAKSIRVASCRETLQLALAEYDKTCSFERARKEGLISPKHAETTTFKIIHKRRALRLIIEQITAHYRDAPVMTQDKSALYHANVVWFAASEMVSASIDSEALTRLFPSEAQITVLPGDTGYRFQIDFKELLDFESHMASVLPNTLPMLIRHDLSTTPLDADLVKNIIDPVFTRRFGAGIFDYIGVINDSAKHVITRSYDLGVPFIEQKFLAENVQRATGASRKQVRQILKGLSLTPAAASDSADEHWKMSREYRTRSRPLIALQYNNVPHFAYSLGMLEEGVLMRLIDATYRKLPDEWGNGGLRACIEKYARAVDHRFEQTVAKKLGDFGIDARTIGRTLGAGKKSVKTPDHIGDIDVLAWDRSRKALIVIECKRIKEVFEPIGMAGLRSKLYDQPQGAVAQADRKARWVRRNLKEVCFALSAGHVFHDSVKDCTHSLAMVTTLYEPHREFFNPAAPVYSLGEILDHSEPESFLSKLSK